MRCYPLILAIAVLSSVGPAAVSHASSFDPFEAMLADAEEEDDYLDLLNRLDLALKRPVNLAEADRSAISGLPWVSPLLAGRIVDLRKSGGLRSLDDLKKIEGVDDRLVELVRPFAVVEYPRKRLSRVRGLVRLRMISSPTSGSREQLKTYLRSSLEYGGCEAGIILEKDRDEPRVNDFQSYYFGVRGDWGEVVAGDFVLASGHGLVFSNPYGHSPATVSPWRFSQGDFGIRPYTSVDENFMLHGVGLSLKHRNLAVCMAASRSKFDARLDDEGRVNALNLSGYHRWGNEIEDKDALQEDLLALATRYLAGPVDVRLTLSHTTFNRDFSPEFTPGAPEALSKDENLTASVDLSLTGGESTLFVEAAGGGAGAEAVIGGLAFDRQSVDFLLLGRAYGKRFVSLHARPFSFYSGLATGEKGILTRVVLKPVANGVLAIGADLHERSAPEGGLAPPSGSESFLDAEVRAGGLVLSLGEKLLVSEEPPSREGDATEMRSRLRSRVDVRYRVSRSVWVRARYEDLRAKKEVEASCERSFSDLVRLDVGIDIGKAAEAKAGVYTFSIGDYASRIYQYEAGLPYYPTLQMLKSDGSRWYTVVSLRGRSLGTFVAKYGRTTYQGEKSRSELLCYYNLRI